jgi:hypothetical protein
MGQLLGGLAWERTYRLNNKYVCLEDDSWTSSCIYYEQLYCPYWGCERWAIWLEGEVHTSHETAILLQKREATPDYTLGAYKPVNFTIFTLNETGWEVGKKFGILINGKGIDLSTLLHFQLITHKSSSYQVFHSFYEEIQSELPISVKTKNLFLSLAESIAQTLNITLCYVCGGMNMGDHWPWEVKQLNPQGPLDETTLPILGESIWLLKTSFIGNDCISCQKANSQPQ